MNITINICIAIKLFVLSFSAILLILTLNIYRMLPQLRRMLVSIIKITSISSIYCMIILGRLYIEYDSLWNSCSIYENEFTF